MLGKRTIEDFTIIKTYSGKLAWIHEKDIPEDVAEEVSQITPIYKYCEEKGIPFIYLNSILALQTESDIPYLGVDQQRQNAELVRYTVEHEGIPYVDLQSFDSVMALDKTNLFYRTDHHWSLQCCFAVFNGLVDIFNRELNFCIDDYYCDIDNYEKRVWEDSFLGSYGVKVGKYYAGKDDFVVYVPKFATNFTFEAYDSEGNKILEKNGEWFECLMDQEILFDNNYDNKYNVWSNFGYVENRIINNMWKNDAKVLYISHSYGRPMTQYLATCFREVRNLDPQEGRFSGNYIEYIDEYEPDLVILQAESEGTLCGVYDTKR